MIILYSAILNTEGAFITDILKIIISNLKHKNTNQFNNDDKVTVKQISIAIYINKYKFIKFLRERKIEHDHTIIYFYQSITLDSILHLVLNRQLHSTHFVDFTLNL